MLAVYMAPSIVGWARRHHNAMAITALNVFLGWTLLGWVACLVSALTKPRRRRRHDVAGASLALAT
jgi:hypothetical protein